MNADEDMQDAGTRDSFCSSASTDPGGGVSPRESMPALSPCASPRAHEEATRAGSVPAAAAEVQDAASRPPGADSFPFAGPAPPGWKPDASFSLEHALHKELLQQLITLVVDTRGSSLVFLLLAFLLQLSRVFRAHIPKSLSLPRLLDRRVSRPNPGSLPRNPLFPLSTVSSLFINHLVPLSSPSLSLSLSVCVCACVCVCLFLFLCASLYPLSLSLSLWLLSLSFFLSLSLSLSSPSLFSLVSLLSLTSPDLHLGKARHRVCEGVHERERERARESEKDKLK